MREGKERKENTENRMYTSLKEGKKKVRKKRRTEGRKKKEEKKEGKKKERRKQERKGGRKLVMKENWTYKVNDSTWMYTPHLVDELWTKSSFPNASRRVLTSRDIISF